VAKELWLGIELVKNADGMMEPVVCGAFTKKVRAMKSGDEMKYTFVMPVRLNQVLPDNYFMEHVEQ